MASTAVAVSVLIVMAPASLGTTAHAPFHGVATAFFYTAQLGCGKEAGNSTFSLQTGLEFADASASTKTCAKSGGKVGLASEESHIAGNDIGLRVFLPGGFHKLSTHWSMHLLSRGVENPGAVCPTPKQYYNSYSYSYGGSQYWINNTGADVYCYAVTQTSVTILSYLLDLTTGATLNATYDTIVGSSIETYNSTSWNCYNNTVWNGTGYSYSQGCFGYNQTTESTAFIGGVYYPTWSAPTSFNNTTVALPVIWYNNSYSATDHYTVFFELTVAAMSEVTGWVRASASASLDMGTSGEYGQLVKVVVR